MNSLLLRVDTRKNLKSFTTYHRTEADAPHAVTDTGDLLEYETLELRVHPPNVEIDNTSLEDRTVLTIDSANRPGTLVEVVQCLTELGLSIQRARISSDGGWFVDEFHISELPSGRVTDPAKLGEMTTMMAPHAQDEKGPTDTVFQMAGPDRKGFLAEVSRLLLHNGCEVRSMAVWTYKQRAACVLAVRENGRPVLEKGKLGRLKHIMHSLLGAGGQQAVVSVEQVRTNVHHERRLHQLMLADEQHAWKELSRLQKQVSLPFPGWGVEAAAMAAELGRRAGSGSSASGQPGQLDTPLGSDQLSTPGGTLAGRAKLRTPIWELGSGEIRAAASGGKAGDAPTPAPPTPASRDAPAAATRVGSAVPAANPAEPASAAAEGFGSYVSTGAVTGTPEPAGQQDGNTLAAAQAHESGDAAAGVDVPDHDRSPFQDAYLPPLRVKSPPEAAEPFGASPTGKAADAATASIVAALSPSQPPASTSTSGVAAEPAGTGLSGQGSAPGGWVLRQGSGGGGLSWQHSAGMGPPASPGVARPPRSPAPPRPPPLQLQLPVVPPSPRGVPASPSLSTAESPRRAGFESPSRAQSTPPSTPKQPAISLVQPRIHIQYSPLRQYWLVEVVCPDRTKLFFDTVCTLADMRFDIFHGTIDSDDQGMASQLYYVRPRFGSVDWDEGKAAMLHAMLESSVQRRFPHGRKVHVLAYGTSCLADLAAAFDGAGMTITRCKVRAFERAYHTFYVLYENGTMPSKEAVRAVVQEVGGHLFAAPLDGSDPDALSAASASLVRASQQAQDGGACKRFAFTFVDGRSAQRQRQPSAGGMARTGVPMSPRAAFLGGLVRGVSGAFSVSKPDEDARESYQDA